MSELPVRFSWKPRPDGAHTALVVQTQELAWGVSPCTAAAWVITDVMLRPASTLAARQAAAEAVAERAMEFASYLHNQRQTTIKCSRTPATPPPLSSTHSTFKPRKKL